MWLRSQSYRNQSIGFMNIHNSHPFYHFHPVRLLLQRTGSRTQTGNVWFHNASHEPLNSRSLKCTLSTLVLVAAVVRRILTTRVTLGNIFLACPSLLLLLNLIFFLTLSFDLDECSKWIPFHRYFMGCDIAVVRTCSKKLLQHHTVHHWLRLKQMSLKILFWSSFVKNKIFMLF